MEPCCTGSKPPTQSPAVISKDLEGKPYVVEARPEEDLVIYFESEETKRQYLEIPVEHPIEHRLNLDNPADEMIDEG